MKTPTASLLQRYSAVSLLVLLCLGFVGCASTDPDNASARPWNQPKGWEGGLPGGMYQQQQYR